MKSVQSPARLRFAVRGAMACLPAFGLCQALPALADEVLDSGVTVVSGSSSQTVTLQAPSAGTLTVTLDNLPLEGYLSSLGLLMTTSTSPLQSAWAYVPASETLTESFNVGPGTYFAHIMGEAGGTLDLGIYSVDVTFTPSVPLPGSGWMLLTGVFVMMGLTRLLCSYKPSEGEHPGTLGASA
jgi:hypothetical protein